ncbi:MAG TPA: hypothetical protein VGN17_19140 [Bryobacteraceae bacterium]|jgi:hypothetical protein
MTNRTILTLFMVLARASFAQQLSFVACPIVRDTKTVPCFLADYEGETYYLTIQQDIQAELYPPQLLHEVQVEGTVAAGPRVCGGIPLKPVNLSVLPELNLACNTILPAEPGIEAPPTRRSAGPSTRQAPVVPGAAPLAGRRGAQERLTPPFTEREFKISYASIARLCFRETPALLARRPATPTQPRRSPWRLRHTARHRCFQTDV